MANRDELMIIRSARVGQATAQLALGKRYLFGGGGLPQSLATALHWLERAAEQNQQDAWLLIGNHIPFDIAHQAANPLRIALWYERAYEAGVAKAGLTLAMLVFAHWPRADHSLRQKATGALQMAAESGLPEAQWLLAQQLGIKDMINQIAARLQPHALARRNKAFEWAARAARGGILDAQRVVAHGAWINQDHLKYLFWALPMAQDIERQSEAEGTSSRRTYNPQDLDILARCAQSLLLTADPNCRLIEKYLKLAAEGGGYRSAGFAGIVDGAHGSQRRADYGHSRRGPLQEGLALAINGWRSGFRGSLVCHAADFSEAGIFPPQPR